MGFVLMTRFIGLYDTASDYTLQFIITHTLVSTVMYSPLLLGNGFQQRFLPLCIPELSLPSTTSF
jgi:hypothetical protein